ncbi:MAG TPA: hypothetical protein VHY79_19685 [Rhizomicrobium sp.]|jgi:uncharacterized membrane protein YagU involved in acid resistance|nr:hypothetical protein [Rhizomicrobium sp.]
MTGARSSAWKAILLGGFVAGTIDVEAAALINQVSPVLILHYIAAGLLGPRVALAGGVSVAVLGLILQWAMSLIIASIFVLAARRIPVLIRDWLRSGLAYGVGIFFVMNYIVLPLSAAMAKPHFPHFSAARFIENLLAMLLFGTIVAFFASRYESARQR